MRPLNFEDEDEDENRNAIRAMARDAIDEQDDRLTFDEAVARGLDDDMRRAVDELGEDAAAEIFDEVFAEIDENSEDGYDD